VFSRPAGAFRPAMYPGQRISVATLMKLVDKHLQKIASKIPVGIWKNVTEHGYPENGAKAVLSDGTIYLFRDRLTSLVDARAVLFDKLLHFGVVALLVE
jgi:hypothetical protein